MKTSLLPEKHIRTSESIIGLGAAVLSSLFLKPKNLDGLWKDIMEMGATKHRIHGTVTLDTVVLAIDFLFSIGAIKLSDEGLFKICD